MTRSPGKPDPTLPPGGTPPRLWILCLSLAWGVAMGPAGLSGQEGAYAFQVRGGGTLPVGRFGDPDQGWEKEAGSGPSLGLGFTFPIFRFIGGYLGFSQHRFDCDEEVCAGDEAWVSTGFQVAARMVLGEGRARPWIQGGLHTHRMEGRIISEGEPPDVKGEPRDITSQAGWGYEVGGGILVAIGERTSLSPGVRFVLGNVPFDTSPNMGLRFLVLDLGLVLGF